MNKNILAFDTSMGPCSVAVLRDGRLVANNVLMDSHQQVKMLMPMIEDAMQQAGLTYPDLDAIAVGIGPGSFTGIRIGMAAAHGFALAGNTPLIGITTLEAMVFEALHSPPPLPPLEREDVCIGAMMHAGKGQFYCQWFFGFPPIPTNEPILCTKEQVKKSFPDADCVLVGNAAAEFAPFLAGATLSEITFPHAQHIAQLAALRALKGTLHLEPLYIRPPDAKPSQR